jgi:hopanoid biosynthesis associated RND transporter like protein HpnN
MEGDKVHTRHRRIQRMPRRVVRFMLRYPVAVVLTAVLGAVVALCYTATHLAFDSNRLDLISAGEHYTHLDAAFSRELADLPGSMVVVMQSQQPERAKAFATALAQRWETDAHIAQVLYHINVDTLKRKGLLYLSPDQLTELRQQLQAHHAFLHALAASPTLHTLFTLVNQEVTKALVSHLFTGFLQEDTVQEKPPDLSLLLALLQQMNTWLEGSRRYQSPWASVLTESADAVSPDGFLWSDDHQLLFVFVRPKASVSDVSGFRTAIQRVQADVRALHKAYPETAVGLTGSAMLDSDEMVAAARDTTIASVIAVVGVTLLYVSLFHGVARPLLALGTLLIAVCWSLGVTTLTVGHLTIFSIVFMPMLLGLGIDYGSYFIARFEEEQAATRAIQPALIRTFVTTGPGLAATALTTAFTFGTLLVPGFKGVAELGFIGGSGMLLTLLATCTVLPASLVWHERHRRVRPTRQRRRGAERPGDYLAVCYRYPRASLAASALLVGLSLWYIGRVGADFNLLHLQARGTESVVWEQKIFESTQQSPLFGELAAESLAEVTRKVAALKALPSVAKVESIMSVIPEEQAQKLPLIEALRPLLADISLQGGTAEVVDLETLRSILGRIGFKMADNDGGQAPQEDATRQQMQEVGRLIAQFDETTARRGDAEARQALSALQAELMHDLGAQLALLQANVQAEPVTAADLPPELRARYIGAHGHYRIIVYPAANAWEFPPLTRFVKDIRAVDPDVLGTPIMNFELIRGMKEAYEQVGLYAFVGIVVLVLLTFRAVRPALLALMPLAVGSLWTLGLMGLFQLKFNVANLIVLPLIMAPAVEGGIMIIYRYREEASKGRRPAPLPPSTGRAVVFSSLSTIVGFASLMISDQQGIFSIGLLLTMGVASVLLASVTVLPSLLTILSTGEHARADATDTDDPPSAAAQPGSNAHQCQLRSTRADGRAQTR